MLSPMIYGPSHVPAWVPDWRAEKKYPTKLDLPYLDTIEVSIGQFGVAHRHYVNWFLTMQFWSKVLGRDKVNREVLVNILDVILKMERASKANRFLRISSGNLAESPLRKSYHANCSCYPEWFLSGIVSYCREAREYMSHPSLWPGYRKHGKSI